MVLLYNTRKTNKKPNSLYINEIAQHTEDNSLMGVEYSTGLLNRMEKQKRQKCCHSSNLYFIFLHY